MKNLTLEHKKKNPSIYCIYCIESGKFYIGSAKTTIRRYNNHFSSLCRNDHSNIRLQRVFNKRKESLIFEPIEYFDEDISLNKLREIEKEYIDMFFMKDKNLLNLINTTKGGSIVYDEKRKIEIGKKISKTFKERGIGKILGDKTRKRLLNMPKEEKQKIYDKRNTTMQNKSEEEKKEINEKISNTLKNLPTEERERINSLCVKRGEDNGCATPPITLIHIDTKEIKTLMKNEWRLQENVNIFGLINKRIHHSKGWTLYEGDDKNYEYVNKNKPHTLYNINSKELLTMPHNKWAEKYNVHPSHLNKGMYLFSQGGWTLYRGDDFDYSSLINRETVKLINIKTLEIEELTHTEWVYKYNVNSSMLKANHKKSLHGWRVYDENIDKEFYKISPRARSKYTLRHIETNEIKTLTTNEWKHIHGVRATSLKTFTQRTSKGWAFVKYEEL